MDPMAFGSVLAILLVLTCFKFGDHSRRGGTLSHRHPWLGKALIVVAVLLLVIAWITHPTWYQSLLAFSVHPPSHAYAMSVSPSSAPDYVTMARQEAVQAGIDPDIFQRQIKQESNFDPQALSSAGAQGIAQFMPPTAQALGVDPWNAPEALKAAARLMARYVQQYGGDYAKALAAYNAGSGTVATAIATGGEHWRSYLPAETQHYITIILQEG